MIHFTLMRVVYFHRIALATANSHGSGRIVAGQFRRTIVVCPS
ncbi:MAG: hypothetical protein ACI9OJ_003134 [Myxococcota bacterium]|jgi:hypothetical protein